MTQGTQLTTADQLLQMTGLGRCELLRGELVMMSPAGFGHGRVAHRVGMHLGKFVQARRLGVVTAAETGFQIGRDPDTVRAPDVAFISSRRIPEEEPAGFFPGAPDLAVEVLSPNDRASEVIAKVQDWLDAGSVLVGVVDPQTRMVSVYRGRAEALLCRAGDVLEGGDVLPGFRLAVDEIFSST